MIIDKLNKIQNYISKPKSMKIELGEIFSNNLLEEYFWKKASAKNQYIIFQNVLQHDSKYFIRNFKRIIEEKKWTQSEYWSILFIRELSISMNKQDCDFTNLIKLVDDFIEIVYNNLNEQQSLWFIADTIMYFPLNSISDSHIKFISEKTLVNHPSMVANTIEKELLPRVIEARNEELLIKIINDLLFAHSEKPTPHEHGAFRSGNDIRFDSYILSRIINKDNIRLFKELIGSDRLAEIIISILSKLSSNDPYGYSSLGLPSIEDTNQIWDKNGFTYISMKFLRDFLELENPGIDFVKDKLLSSATKVVRRLGMHAVNFYYHDLKSVFWSLENPLSDNDLKHEIFYLLEKNAASISKTELEILFKWIDNIIVEKWSEDQTKEDLEKSRALIGKEFLAALINIDESLKEKVKSKKQELDDIHPYDREHPGFNSYSSTSFGNDYPDTFETYQTHTKSIDDLLEYFSKESEWSKSEKLGQASLLEDTFSKRTDFINDTEKLFKLKIGYFESIIYGLQKGFENGKEINWKAFFRLSNKIIELDIDIKKSLVGYISWLLQEALKDDNNERGIFGEDLETAKKIILKLLRLQYNSERINNDPQFDILNSTEGKILDATVALLLRNARLNKKEDKDKWYSEIKEHYTTIIKSENCTDAYINNITKFLPQFGYLDKSWLEENIDFIFPQAKNDLWKLAMTTYTRMTNSVYKDIFDILLEKGHYDFGIEVMKGEEDGVSDFIQQIVVAYIAGWEGQQLIDNESLINKLLKNGDEKQITHIITSLFRYRGNVKDKVVPLWKAILECDLDEKIEQVILKESLKLINKVDIIGDEEFEVIETTLEKIVVKDDLYEPVRYLANSESEDIENRMKLLMIGTSSNLQEHHMHNIFEDMAKKVYPKNPKLTDEFLENLVSKRVFSLIDVYNELHSK